MDSQNFGNVYGFAVSPGPKSSENLITGPVENWIKSQLDYQIIKTSRHQGKNKDKIRIKKSSFTAPQTAIF